MSKQNWLKTVPNPQFSSFVVGQPLRVFIFQQIVVSFLPKGHTHVDVDQMFSRLSVAIARSGCLTPTDLRRLIGSCYKQTQGDVTQAGARPQVAQLQHLYAIREWLKPHSWEVHYLRSFHQFRFYLDERGKCLTDFKPWCKGKSLLNKFSVQNRAVLCVHAFTNKIEMTIPGFRYIVNYTGRKD